MAKINKKVKIKATDHFLSQNTFKKITKNPKKHYFGIEIFLINFLFWLIIFLIYLLVTKTIVYDALLVASICSFGISILMWISGAKSNVKVRYHTQKIFNPFLNGVANFLSFKPKWIDPKKYDNYQDYQAWVQEKYQNRKKWYWINFLIQFFLLILSLILFFSLTTAK